MLPITASRLPYELIRAIFELAAARSRQAALILILVSHTTRKWLEPLLYNNVYLLSIAHRDVFQKCRITRNDDAFIASAVRRLHVAPHTASPSLILCNNITHLSLQGPSDNFYYLPCPSLHHLKNLQYLGLYDLDSVLSYSPPLPPNITHIQLRDPFMVLDESTLPSFVEGCPSLSHFMLDCDEEEFSHSLPAVLGSLPSQCRRIAITVPPLDDDDKLGEMRELQERYPQLILVDTGRTSVLESAMHCEVSLVSRFEFWDEMEAFLARTCA